MNKSIKVLCFLFSFVFLIIISSFIYFWVFKSEYYANHELNKRQWEYNSKYTRGKILDRNGEVLVYTDENQKRIYNYGEAFFHPIGYLSNKYGSAGIENYMNEYLKKPSGFLVSIKEFFNNNPKYLGNDVKLTLHKDIQKYAYDLMGNNKGSIVVTNPITGEIYALVSKPAIDPNYIDSLWDNVSNHKDAPFFNRATKALYPPGSTFKILTSAASIEKNGNIVNREFNDKGYIEFNKKEKFFNQDKKAYGKINLERAFVHSSNVVFGNLAIELGNSYFKKYVEKFNFNKNIFIEGLNVEKSKFPPLLSNEIGLIAQSGVGQGNVLATPLIMVMVANTIANKGVIKKPYIISHVLDYNSSIIKKNNSYIIGKPMKKYTANIIKQYMKKVVEENLSNIKEFSYINAAGKTGTADHKKNGVDAVPHSWFVGFAPYDNPKVSVAVIVEEGGNGSGIASNIAAKVMNMSVKLLK